MSETAANIVQFLFYASIVATYVYLTASWVRWANFHDRSPVSSVRYVLAFGGLLAATASALLSLALLVHALLTGGFPFYHPLLLASIRFGFLSSLLGIVLGCVGKGFPRLPAVVCSVLLLFAWLVEAMAQ